MLLSRSPERLRRRPLGRYRYVRLRWRVFFSCLDTLGTALVKAARIWGLSRLSRRGLSQFSRSENGTVPFTQGTNTPNDPRTILLIQLDHLGDAVLSTVMLGPLRKRYPNASIEVLASTANREVFEAAPQIDRVYVSRVNRFARAGRFGWIAATILWGLRLRRRGVDLGVDVRGDFPAAVILWLCGARRRLGWDSGGGGFLLTDVADFVHGRPEVQSRLALLARLGIEPSQTDEPWRPVFRPSESARGRVNVLFGRPSVRLPAPWRVVIHVGAGTPAKRWPAEHWRTLIGRIVERYGARVVLVGGPSDRAVAQAILGPMPPVGVVDAAGQCSVDELAAVLSACDLFIGADSGPAHLAAAVGTPAVVLFSGTNSPRQWQPCGPEVRVLRHRVPCSPCHRQRCPWAHHPCTRGLTPERVAAEVESLITEPHEAVPHQEETAG